MTDYIDIYRDARRKLGPVESLYYTLGEAKSICPALKQFYYKDTNLLMSQIMQSARILVLSERDFQDFIKVGCREYSIDFVKQQSAIAKAHLSHYIGEKVINLFLAEYIAMNC